jgi:hypothetical protein
MITTVILALLFLAVPTAALTTNSTIPPNCDDEECIDDSTPDMAGCWTMECVKGQLIEDCEAWVKPSYIDCNTILQCINVTEIQSDRCAGDGYPAIVFRKI